MRLQGVPAKDGKLIGKKVVLISQSGASCTACRHDRQIETAIRVSLFSLHAFDTLFIPGRGNMWSAGLMVIHANS